MPEVEPTARIARQVFLGTMVPDLHYENLSWAFDRLAERMSDVYAKAGLTLYSAGETAEEYYFVVEGEVRVMGEGRPTWTFGPRSVIGNLDALLERPRARTAVALSDVHLLALRNEDWLEILEDNFDLTRAVLRNIGRDIEALRLRLAPSGGFAEPAPSTTRYPGDPLNLAERILALRSVSAFARAGIQTLSVLAAAAEEVRFAAGEALFGEGASHEQLDVVTHGEVELTHEAPTIVARFGEGSLVGEASFPRDSRYVARATRPTVVQRFRLEEFFDVMEEHFDLARSVIMHLGLTSEGLRDLHPDLARAIPPPQPGTLAPEDGPGHDASRPAT